MQSVPNTLYHATYCAYIDSMLTHGLGAKPIPNWEFSKPNIVYLEAYPNAAESYPETSEIVSDDIMDQINYSGQSKHLYRNKSGWAITP